MRLPSCSDLVQDSHRSPLGPLLSEHQHIAATLYRSRDIEAYGTGLQRIKEACEAQGVPFEVTQRGGSVHVVFMRQEGIAARKDTAEFADNPPTTAKAPPTTSRAQGKATR
jgi:predicted HTH transcriptional regulator